MQHNKNNDICKWCTLEVQHNGNTTNLRSHLTRQSLWNKRLELSHCPAILLQHVCFNAVKLEVKRSDNKSNRSPWTTTKKSGSEPKECDWDIQLPGRLKSFIIMCFGFMWQLMLHLVGMFSPELCGLERSGVNWETEEAVCWRQNSWNSVMITLLLLPLPCSRGKSWPSTVKRKRKKEQLADGKVTSWSNMVTHTKR